VTRQPLPPSLYAETARPPVDTPPLDGDKTVSVAVIGGGITGLSAALHLAESGTDVTVLEAHEPGWGASGRNGGQVNPGLKPDPDEVERDFGPDLGARMVDMSWNAPATTFDLIRRHQIQCDASQTGTIRAAFQQNNVADIESAYRQGAARNMPVELLGADRMQTETGTTRYLTAVLDKRGGHLNPLGYSRGLAQAAIQAGATIHGATPATKVWRDGGKWHAQTPTGTVHADRIVLGTNGYTDNIWPQLRKTIVPVFSAVVASEPLSAEMARDIFPIRSALYELGKVTTYYRLDRQNRVLMGGRSRQSPVSGPNDLMFLRSYAERLWPQLKGIAWTHGWNGQLAITLDHYPHIHEPAPGVTVCLGYNGRGVAMATAMGPQLTKRILGGSTADIDMPITDLKPVPFHALWRTGVAARIAYGRIRDYLHI